MYEESFSTDWRGDDLSREEAVWRAYALGVAAVLGEQNREEYRQLVAAAGRSLVEMAYDEGKTSAADLDRELASDPESDTESDTEFEFPSRSDAVWSKLITRERTRSDTEPRDASETSSRTDLPAFLEGIDLDSLDRDDLEQLQFPDFLTRR